MFNYVGFLYLIQFVTLNCAKTAIRYTLKLAKYTLLPFITFTIHQSRT